MNKTVLAATAATALLALTGCGGSNDDTTTTTDPSSSSTPTPSASSSTSGTKDSQKSVENADDGTVVDVAIEGDTVTPNGERIDAKTGEPITINVTSDRAGELHVHSTPEQELEYGVGRTRLTLTVDTPGIVDVEDHVADVVVVQLQVT